ncbi:uncharacterized protein H6S33_002839 [Morchella sextelata]|uniref:uncharacterized protein n=1 Tax=Morchella sextelata TaxID=1174677 RepID=UPI001D04C8E1|nr:uncharacterized protein H6S33_002839 [Morchella sextelata]KAH0607805.1 hypothetical protein H6S33_002839 [Morchella sextelata]
MPFLKEERPPSYVAQTTSSYLAGLASNVFAKKRFSKKLASLIERTKKLVKKPFEKAGLGKPKARQAAALKTSPQDNRGSARQAAALKTSPQDNRDQEFARVALIIMRAGVLDPVFVFFCTYPYRYNPMGQVFERVSRFTEHFD